MNLDELIKSAMNEKERMWYKWGEDYYESENTAIMDRKKEYYSIDTLRLEEHPYKANHKMPSGYLRIHVDQKVEYLMGNGIRVSSEETELYNELFGDKLDDFVTELATESSKKGIAWCHPYIKDNEFKYMEIPPEQAIPFYNSKGELTKLFRYYLSYRDDSKVEVVEVWDDEQVVTHIKPKNGKWIVESESPHVIISTVNNGNEVASRSFSWGMVPFIPLYNNKSKSSDLKPIKAYVDVYDVINSDFANNIDDMQDAFFIIKNYAGDNLSEFMEQLKRLKTVPVGEDGDVETRQLEIPVEARKTFLDIANKNIYKFGMAVDTEQLAGGSITNVVIKSMFSNLDLKTDKFEKQIRKFLDKFMSFYNIFRNQILGQIPVEFTFTFDRSMIMNEVELLKANQEQMGVISETTRLANHPWVNDVEAEKEMIEADKEQSMTSLGGDLGFGDE